MNKKQRIILIRNANSYDFGGGERFPVFLAEILDENGFDSFIVSRSDKLLTFAKDYSVKTIRGWWWSWQNFSGKFVFLFPIYIIWQFILFFWYLQLFIRINPIAVHIQSKDDFIAATFAGKLLGKRVIWTDHGDLKHIWKNIGIWYKNPVGKLVYLSALLSNKIVIVSNNENKLICDNLKLKSKVISKIQIIYNGSHDKLKLYKKEKNDKFTFIFVGRLVTDKGVGEVINAFDKLSKTERNIQLQIIGDGPDEDKFKKLAINNKDINFLGYKSNPYQDMINADVFINASYHEAFGIVVVEAAMLQLPIIASNIGGIPEIITDNKSGLLVKPKDVESLYTAMKKLYQNKELSKTLSINARIQFEDKFNFDNIVKKQYIPLYKDKL